MTTIELPSTQSLWIQMLFGNQPLATGTAFVCESKKGPVLLTNWHNVTGRDPLSKELLLPNGAVPDRLRIAHNSANGLGQWVIKQESLLKNGIPQWVGHPKHAEKVDAVALPLSDLADVKLYPYDPRGGPAISYKPAEPVSVVGFPFGIQVGGSLAIWATGFVASEPEIDFEGLPKFLIDCRTRPGQSGSAVIAHRSGSSSMQGGGTRIFSGTMTRFLGIYSGRIHAESDIGTVWKASAVAEIIESL